MKRTFKRILSTLLIAVMLFGIAPTVGINFAPKASASVADIVTFGSYPQSRVTDSATVNKLNTLVKNYTWHDFNYYSGTGSWGDGKMTVRKGMMQYMDISYNGVKYRAVALNEYRPYFTGYNINDNKTHQSINGYKTGNIYYFKFEPLVWRILDSEDGLVMCDKIIDSQAFQNVLYNYSGTYYCSDSKYASNWEASSLRKWLNEDFYNTAFSTTEQKRILTTKVVSDPLLPSTQYGGDTNDKVFILSKEQATNAYYGFSDRADSKDYEKRMQGTAYAKCQGLEILLNGYSNWLLRTPVGNEGYAVASVYITGAVDIKCTVGFTGSGIVPAMKLDFKSSCIQHSYIPSVTSPTCAERGYTTYTCSNCGHSYVTDYVDTLPHEFGEWSVVTEPTVDSTGLKIRRCKKCHMLQSMVLNKLPSVTVKLNDVNATYKKSGKIVPEISNPANVGYTVKFVSSSPETVSVDNNGNFRALKTGEAKITCTVTDANGNASSASCKVKVSYAWWQWIIRIVLFGWIWY